MSSRPRPSRFSFGSRALSACAMCCKCALSKHPMGRSLLNADAGGLGTRMYVTSPTGGAVLRGRRRNLSGEFEVVGSASVMAFASSALGVEGYVVGAHRWKRKQIEKSLRSPLARSGRGISADEVIG